MLQTVLKYYWLQAKKYPKSGIAVFVLYIIAGILANTIVPLIYKEIIDVASLGVINNEAVSGIFMWVWILGGSVVVYNVLFRLGDYFGVFFESHILRDLADFTFQKVHEQSYAFFADNFSGSLVSKTKRFIGSFSSVFNNFLW